ncbi:MAG: transposase [Flavobacteriaceae bacterium]|nr:transposase [Flavobacteriaceae bacterium]
MENQPINKINRIRISKKGNSYIRQVLYISTLIVYRFKEEFQPFYKQLNENRNIIKNLSIA